MAAQLPSLLGGPQTLGLAWTIPVLLLVYIGLGFWLGGLLGSRLAGILVGWIVGMGAVFYEIRKVLRSGADSNRTPPVPPKGDST